VRIALFALALLAIAGAARAQSFDCDQAKAPAERLVCRDRRLGRLDVDMLSAYWRAVDLAAQPKAVIQDQRAWLKRRDACGDSRCLTDLYGQRIAALKAAQPAGWSHYSDRSLGVSFDLLANRSVQPCDGQPSCLSIRGWLNAQRLELIEISVLNGPIEKAAREQALYEFKDGRWMTTAGPGQPVPVERFNADGLAGMRATVTCGLEDKETGYHAGAGDCLSVVLSNGKRSVVIDVEGRSSDIPATLRTVNSVRLDR
jgi:uncharacterized protein